VVFYLRGYSSGAKFGNIARVDAGAKLVQVVCTTTRNMRANRYQVGDNPIDEWE